MSGHRFVFCEGPDDVSVVRGLVGLLQVDLQVEPFRGKNNLRNFLKQVKERPEFASQSVKAIGVIRDADESAASAFQSVHEALSNNGFTPPEANGQIASGPVKTGILVQPEDRGEIEHLCLRSVSDLPEYACLEDYFQCLTERTGGKSFSSSARIRAWMATQPDTSLYVGKAAEKGYWPLEHAAFEPLRVFLKALSED
jgi:hypothetical protein